jgi:hypothetical protein
MLDANAVATELGKLGRMCMVEPNMPDFLFCESAQLMRSGQVRRNKLLQKGTVCVLRYFSKTNVPAVRHRP